MENPCYDISTKTDCSERHEGCAAKCSKWAEYVKKRNEYYDKKNIENAALVAIYDIHMKRQDANQRALTRKRHSKRPGKKDI